MYLFLKYKTILQMKEKSTKELYVNYYMTENTSSTSCLKQNYTISLNKITNSVGKVYHYGKTSISP